MNLEGINCTVTRGIVIITTGIKGTDYMYIINDSRLYVHTK